MKESARRQSVRQQTKGKILRYIWEHERVTKQTIARGLHLSMPTVLQNVRELSQAGLVEGQGMLESTGGRRAHQLSVVREARFAAGAEVTAHQVSLVLLDLSGSVVASQRTDCRYEDTPGYYRAFGELAGRFLAEQRVPENRLLGIGVSLPGNIDPEQDVMLQSHALGVYQLPLQRFRQFLPCEARFCNDANAGGLAERRWMPETSLYLSLGGTVGGAIFLNGALYGGGQHKSGEFGHMTLVPEGRACYCGRRGCMDAYCSSRVLAGLAGGDLDAFFHRLAAEDAACAAAWEEYLHWLAAAVVNLRMAFDCPIVLGGEVGGYLPPYLPRLKRLAACGNPFDGNADYLLPCRLRKEACAMGAGLQFLELFYDQAESLCG